MIDHPLAMLTFALVLSLGVERLLEILRCYEKYREAKRQDLSKWNRRAEKIQSNLQGQLDNQNVDNFNPLMLFFSRYLVYKETNRGKALVVSADAVRTTMLKAQYKLLAVTFGISVALGFNINVFSLVDELGPTALWFDSFIGRNSFILFGEFLTGIAIGFGSGPLHEIITALERARNPRLGVK